MRLSLLLHAFAGNRKVGIWLTHFILIQSGTVAYTDRDGKEVLKIAWLETEHVLVQNLIAMLFNRELIHGGCNQNNLHVLAATIWEDMQRQCSGESLSRIEVVYYDWRS